MNNITLSKTNNSYYWESNNSKTEELPRAKARAFGVWWMRLDRNDVDKAFDIIDKEASGKAVFLDNGDFAGLH